MKCNFCGETFVDSHSCKVDLNEIPALRARVSELEELSEKLVGKLTKHNLELQARVSELEAIHNAARTELDNYRGYMNSDAYHTLSNALNP